VEEEWTESGGRVDGDVLRVTAKVENRGEKGVGINCKTTVISLYSVMPTL
jgi:hypothetical protein